MIPQKLDKLEFATTVREHRERIGIGQKELGEVIGVSHRTVWQMENAERETPYNAQVGTLEILKHYRPIKTTK